MSVRRDHQLIIFQCDECGDEHNSESDEWDAAWRAAKDHGWRAVKITEKEWEHRCKECR